MKDVAYWQLARWANYKNYGRCARHIAIVQQSLVADPRTLALAGKSVHTSIKYKKLLSTVQSTVKRN